jgi:hypothetical protein
MVNVTVKQQRKIWLGRLLFNRSSGLNNPPSRKVTGLPLFFRIIISLVSVIQSGYQVSEQMSIIVKDGKLSIYSCIKEKA